MSVWNKKSRILITCPKGVSDCLKAEVSALGFSVTNQWDTAIQTEGNLIDTMRMNLHLRTAQRVLYQLETFIADTPELLYRKTNAIPWENLLHESGRAAYVCVTSITDNPAITDSRFANLKVKDAIVDRIRVQSGTRPDSGPDKDKAVIHVYWKNNRADVYIDTSGERLSLRGYRKIPLYAPMQETLAAAVIMTTGWNGKSHFINPMCGSGTLAIEAALMALNRAPGSLRNNYGFMFIKDFPEKDWLQLRKNARDMTLKKLPIKIIATDFDQTAVAAARQNAQTAGVDRLIEFETCPFEQTPIPHDGGGTIVINPPYGERMQASDPGKPSTSYHGISKASSDGKKIILRKSRDQQKEGFRSGGRPFRKLEKIYTDIGNFFKNAGPGYYGYIFTGNLELTKKVGLRTKRRVILYNGDIECRLLEYELYAGSHKNPGNHEENPGENRQ
jgi:putative N6-adenine-specific DNA methylase